MKYAIVTAFWSVVFVLVFLWLLLKDWEATCQYSKGLYEGFCHKYGDDYNRHIINKYRRLCYYDGYQWGHILRNFAKGAGVAIGISVTVILIFLSCLWATL